MNFQTVSQKRELARAKRPFDPLRELTRLVVDLKIALAKAAAYDNAHIFQRRKH